MPRASRLVALLAVAGLSGCGGGGDGGTGPSPTTVAQTTTTPVTATAPPATTPAPPALDPLDWRSAKHAGQPIGLVRAPSGFFGIETRAVASLSSSGTVRWRFAGPPTDDFRGFVVHGIPIAVPAVGHQPRKGPRPHAVKGLDPRSGHVRWSHPTTSYAFADARQVYAPTCTGAQTGALGECTLTAYDPRTGAARWSTPVFANLEESQTGDGALVVQTFPTGDRPRFLVLDPASGAIRATIDLAGGHYLALVGRRLVDAGESRPPARSRCRAHITAYDLDGAAVWHRTLKVGRLRNRDCDAYDASPVGGDVALGGTASRPLLLDPATGRTVWSGAPGGRIDGEAGGRLIVELREAQRTVGIDRATDATVWTYRGIIGGWKLGGRSIATNVLCEQSRQCALVLDARTGRTRLTVPGVPESFVPAAGRHRGGLLTRIDDGERYAAEYGFVSL